MVYTLSIKVEFGKLVLQFLK